MILRRPYAFLIKHFRIIHLILFTLFVYITYKARNILNLFKDYITNNSVNFMSSDYISYFIFVSILLIVIISVVIYLLMRYKKKPRFFYIMIIIISVISGAIFICLYNNIKVLEVSILSSKEIRLLRDISRLNFWSLILTSIPILIRGLGFDIKKFNFSSDLKELKLEAKDSEEVEVNVEINSDTIHRTGRRIGRELKYYYLENKFIINCIIVTTIIILIFMYPFNKYIVNRDLNEGEILGTNYFNFKVNESYISNRNRTSSNNSYVILKVSVIGKINKYKLNLDELVLSSNDNSYIPSLKYYYYFSDIGKGYKNNTLNINDYEDYILVYNINEKDANDDLLFNYINNEKRIILKPKVLK